MTYEYVERGPMARSAGAMSREVVGPRVIVEDPDRDLVARWQAGDEQAFEELVVRHERRVFRLLYRMMGNK
ncbi:MAG TPA: hypothetical protein PLW10_16305, partial [Myxococcota bacterium]|nr:hypothetical protein [Myxococcota bacterium]